LKIVVFHVAISYIFNHDNSCFKLLGILEAFSFHNFSKNSSKVRFSQFDQSNENNISLILVSPFDLGQIIHHFVGFSEKYTIFCHAFIFTSFFFFVENHNQVHPILNSNFSFLSISSNFLFSRINFISFTFFQFIFQFTILFKIKSISFM